jgi:RNA polymerase subunit RPABC4/transcription elongation factor Spt4
MPAMATQPFCRTCGTSIDGTRQFCERCGVFLGEASWAPRSAKVCSKCGSVSAPDRTVCGRCRTSFVTGFDEMWEGHILVDPDSVAPASGPTAPPGEGGCTVCGFLNGPGESFCANCGHFLDWDGTPGPEIPPHMRPEAPP